MGAHIFGFWGKKVLQVTFSKHTKMFVLQVKSKVFFIQFKKQVNSLQDDLFEGLIRQIHKYKVTKLGLRKLHICPKVTKMGSIIGHRIDYNGVEALRCQRHIPSKKNNRSTPRGTAPRQSLKWRVKYRIGVHTIAEQLLHIVCECSHKQSVTVSSPTLIQITEETGFTGGINSLTRFPFPFPPLVTLLEAPIPLSFLQSSPLPRGYLQRLAFSETQANLCKLQSVYNHPLPRKKNENREEFFEEAAVYGIPKLVHLQQFHSYRQRTFFFTEASMLILL